MMSNLPPTIGMKELASVLHISVRTVKRYLAEKPSALPPGKQIGGRWVWVTKAVFDWLSPPIPSSHKGWSDLLKK